VSSRRLPVGAELIDSGAHFRVWAPRRRRVDVVLEGRAIIPLEPEPEGYFSAHVPGVKEGARYRLRLDGDGLYPDPASRYQPEGPHGPSQIVDPSRYRWTDGEWKGVSIEGQVLYEMHVGSFTREGTWRSAAAALERLRGVCSVIEMMPIADFAGDFGWGYDGVDFFAPTRAYGTPDDLRAFVDRAHALGFGVMLDVVYNHAGPDGNYLAEFSDSYFTDRHKTAWGQAVNYDGPGSGGVREFFLANAGYWVDEYRFDGLRLDATDSIFDDSAPHLLAEIGRRVRSSARGRSTIVVAENEPQDTRLVRPLEAGGYGLDGVWNDDIHHAAYVALTGKAEAYFSDYRGTPQELVSAAKHGYLFQGQVYSWQKARRGSSTRGVEPWRFVNYLETHDQVANTGGGKRLSLSAHPGRLRALTAYLLLGPGTPMLFQGQEFASAAPFLFFAHHGPPLADAVAKGRAEFLHQFPSAKAAGDARFDHPADPATLARCKLDETRGSEEWLALHRDLFELRRTDPTVRAQGRYGIDGAVLGEGAFVLRRSGEREDTDRLLVVNLGADRTLVPAAEPLLAPPNGKPWKTLWSSESPRYGGDGVVPVDTPDGWRLRGESATFLAPSTDDDD
jgi:maltooligosyltrehalose trehalohydrolase